MTKLFTFSTALFLFGLNVFASDVLTCIQTESTPYFNEVKHNPKTGYFKISHGTPSEDLTGFLNSNEWSKDWQEVQIHPSVGTRSNYTLTFRNLATETFVESDINCIERSQMSPEEKCELSVLKRYTEFGREFVAYPITGSNDLGGSVESTNLSGALCSTRIRCRESNDFEAQGVDNMCEGQLD